MPAFGAIKRADPIRYLRQAGFAAPRAGGRHQFMLKDSRKLILPNPHRSDISSSLLARLLRQAGITRNEWEAL
jgi:predicted RNA binding protein YcfA (HicA-like mRNA interferase family)